MFQRKAYWSRNRDGMSCVAVEPAVGEVAARLGAALSGPASPENFAASSMIRSVLARAERLVLSSDFRQRHAGHLRQPSTASGKLMPSVSMMKSKMPLFAQEKSNHASF
jgi:hypothetical protein